MTVLARAATVQPGTCYLVGAGPGDPGLLTLRGREVLAAADAVVHDALLNPQMLNWARADAQIFDAGKRAGRHSMKQEQINQLLIEQTRKGHSVARLKGGDPWLFGRGAEEALALADAGIPFEIVPGVSSALAGPAYAGIPLTHRELASAVTIFTGQEDPTKDCDTLDPALLAKAPGTKVMLMGHRRLEEISRQLLAGGMAPETPVAVIRWATTGRQQTITGSLATIADTVREAGIEPPALVLFGEVVRLRDRLRWFEKRPLLGRRIVITRSRDQAGELATRLGALGADVLELPTIRIHPPVDPTRLAEATRDAHQYDWIVFTSPNGVDAFFTQFFKLYKDAREIGSARLASIGPATTRKIESYHLQVDACPEEALSEKILDALHKIGSVENLTFLLPRAEIATDTLPRLLEKHGAIVDQVVAYRTLPEEEDRTGARSLLREHGADLIAFTSSSTVTNFLALDLPLSKTIAIASIGPVTSLTLREHKLRVDVEAKEHDVPGLTQAILNHFQHTPTQPTPETPQEP